jgi:hypothetical protein
VSENPYAPPKSVVADPATVEGAPIAASTLLYSSGQVAVAAFLGAVPAAAWLIAANYRAIGRPRAARKTWWWGAAGTLVGSSLGFLLPEKFPHSFLPLAVTFGFQGLARQLFATVLDAHERTGGAFHSWWRVIGIGLLGMLLVFALISIGVLAQIFVAGGARN